jgi:putative transposase
VIHVRQKLNTSERRTCKVVGLARSSLQYKAAPKDDDALRLAMIRLAKQYGRYGYRKVAKLLRIEGWHVNHKKIERLWQEEGLQLPHRHRKRKRLYHKDSSIIRLRPTHPNHVWSIDFVHDKLSNGRPGVLGARARCFLKNAIPRVQKNSCCTSGVKASVRR